MIKLTRSVSKEPVEYHKVVDLRNGRFQAVMFLQKWEKLGRWSIDCKMSNAYRLSLSTTGNIQKQLPLSLWFSCINLLWETSKLALLWYPKPTPRFSAVTNRWFSGSFSDWKVTISYLIKVYFCSKLSLQKELLLIIACFSVNHWMCMFAIENMDTEPHNCGHEVNNVLPASWQPNTNLLFENLP